MRRRWLSGWVCGESRLPRCLERLNNPQNRSPGEVFPEKLCRWWDPSLTCSELQLSLVSRPRARYQASSLLLGSRCGFCSTGLSLVNVGKGTWKCTYQRYPTDLFDDDLSKGVGNEIDRPLLFLPKQFVHQTLKKHDRAAYVIYLSLVDRVDREICSMVIYIRHRTAERSIRVVYEGYDSSTAKVRREGIFGSKILGPGISPCSSRITLQPMDCNDTKCRKHRVLQHMSMNRFSISLNFDLSTVSRIAAGMKNVKAHCSRIETILKGSLETYRQENWWKATLMAFYPWLGGRLEPTAVCSCAATGIRPKFQLPPCMIPVVLQVNTETKCQSSPRMFLAILQGNTEAYRLFAPPKMKRDQS